MLLLAAAGSLDRDGAREEARRELSRPIYGREEPGWLRHAIDWINEQIARLFDWLDPTPEITGGSPNYTGLGAFAGVIVAVVLGIVLWRWLGPVRRSAKGSVSEDELASPLTARTLRTEAEEHARAGRYAEAVRSRLRALVRMLEERGVLDPRPSRTAGELVDAVTAAVAEDPRGGIDALRRAVTVFNEVWYGGAEATAEMYRVVVQADDALAKVRRAGAGRDEPDDDAGDGGPGDGADGRPATAVAAAPGTSTRQASS